MLYRIHSRQFLLSILGAVGLVFGGCYLLAQTSTQSAQDTAQASQKSTVSSRKVVRGRGALITDPIRIVGVFYDERSIQGSAPIDAPDDWLSHLSVKIRNMSSKPLIAGSFQLTFEGLRGDTDVIHIIRFGMLPEHMLYTPSGVRFHNLWERFQYLQLLPVRR